MMEKSIGKNFVFNLLKTLMSLIFPLITFPYASRILGVDNLGKVQYCNSIISYFSLIATLGIAIYAVRQGSKYRDQQEQLSKFSKEILIINTGSLLFAYGLFITYLLFFFHEEYYTLIVICSFTMLFSTFSIDWLYQIKEDYGYITARSFFVQLVSLVFMFIFVKTKDDYVFYALVSIIGSTGSFIFNIWNARKYINIFQVKNIELHKHIRPIFTIFGVSVASSIYLSLDSVMLGNMVSTVAVGLYSSAVKVAQVVKMLVTSFSNVLFPRLSNYIANNKIQEYKILLHKSIQFILCISIPASIGMFMLSDEIILLFSGESFIEASSAAKILSINIVFSIVDGVLYYQVLLPFGKEKYASLGTLLGAIVNLCLNLIIIPYFSFNGAALTTLIAEICVFFILYYYANKLLKLKYILKYIVKFTFQSIPIIILCMLLRQVLSGVYLLVVSIPLSLVIYGLVLFLMRDTVLDSVKDFCVRR